jgi:uncharacterized integral membrane protein
LTLACLYPKLETRRFFMAIFYLIFALVVAIGAVVFALQNSVQVAVVLFAWSFSGSLSLILLVTLFLGVVIGLLVMLPGSIRRSFQSSGLRRTLKKLKKEKTAAAPASIDGGNRQDSRMSPSGSLSEAPSETPAGDQPTLD